MMRALIFTLLFGSSLFAMDALVNSAWLNKHRADANIVVVDVSDASVYEAGHIPGAVLTSIGEWRQKHGSYLLLRPLDEVVNVIRRLGINHDSKVVLYAHMHGPKEILKASYIYWALDYLGHQEVAILNGGYEQWIEDDGDLSLEKVSVSPGNFKAKPNHRKVADLAYVKSRLGKIPMFDARPAHFYFGMAASGGVKRLGHIKGATSYPWMYSVDEKYRVTSKKVLSEVFKKGFGLKADDEIIVYCTGGLETSFNYFVLSGMLGYKNVRLYDASMKEWGNRHDTAMNYYSWE